MKLLSTAGKKVATVAKAAAAAVERAVAPAEPEEPPKPYDAWMRNERPAELEGRGPGRWLARRRGGWL